MENRVSRLKEAVQEAVPGICPEPGTALDRIL